MKTLSHVVITPEGATLDEKCISRAGISGLYREFIGDYPKFFKMDTLCKLGFIAAELLLKGISGEYLENTAIILFNRNASLVTDRNYQKTIGENGYFPSPALFVYTLANIVTGEIAIRHKIYGETSFHVMDRYDPELIGETASLVSLTSSPSLILAGWVDYNDDTDYLADMRLISPHDQSGLCDFKI